LQEIARPCEPRHHRSDRNVGDTRDLLVRKLLELAQDEHFAVLQRQPGYRICQHPQLGLVHHRLLRGDRDRIDGGVHRLVLVVDDLGGPVAPEPVVERIADDLQEPAARVRTLERADVLQRPYARVLHDVLGVVRVARQPPRKVVGGVQMGQDQRVEASGVGQRILRCFPVIP